MTHYTRWLHHSHRHQAWFAIHHDAPFTDEEFEELPHILWMTEDD
jgi:hypothetical protein